MSAQSDDWRRGTPRLNGKSPDPERLARVLNGDEHGFRLQGEWVPSGAWVTSGAWRPDATLTRKRGSYLADLRAAGFVEFEANVVGPDDDAILDRLSKHSGLSNREMFDLASKRGRMSAEVKQKRDSLIEAACECVRDGDAKDAIAKALKCNRKTVNRWTKGVRSTLRSRRAKCPTEVVR